MKTAAQLRAMFSWRTWDPVTQARMDQIVREAEYDELVAELDREARLKRAAERLGVEVDALTADEVAEALEGTRRIA